MQKVEGWNRFLAEEHTADELHDLNIDLAQQVKQELLENEDLSKAKET